jgi:hypothetical protein
MGAPRGGGRPPRRVAGRGRGGGHRVATRGENRGGAGADARMSAWRWRRIWGRAVHEGGAGFVGSLGEAGGVKECLRRRSRVRKS